MAFERCVNAENTTPEPDWVGAHSNKLEVADILQKHAMQNALFAVLRRNDELLSLCDSMIARSEGSSANSP